MSPRPRTSEDLILRSTIDILAQDGVDGLTVDTVAAAAGVSKATIYRRWGSRAQLIHAAILSLQRPLEEPDTGSLREDLLLLLRQLVGYLSQRDSGRVFASFLDAAAREPELERLRAESTGAARAVYEQVIRRGVDRGELPPEADVSLLIDLVMAPVIYRSYMERKSVRGPYAASVVDAALAAFSQVPTAPA